MLNRVKNHRTFTGLRNSNTTYVNVKQGCTNVMPVVVHDSNTTYVNVKPTEFKGFMFNTIS